jgi:hypothetical protein
MKCLSLIATCLLLIAWIPSLQAQAVSKEKKYSGRFPASKGDLMIDNRYGKLEINTWDRNEVTVDITVKVKASSASCAQDMLDRVRIEEPGENANSITYRTVIESRSCGSNSNELNIDYVVYMPRKHNATLINKYGDVKIADVEGKIEIDVKYGKLTAGSFKGTNNSIRMAYGSSTISSIEAGMIQSAYSKLTIGKAGTVKIANQYGKTEIETVRSLEVDQKYGDLELGTVNMLKCNIQFAGFYVEKLTKSVQLNIKYGSKARFDCVGPDVDNVSVNAGYSNLNFHLDKNASLAGDIDLSYGNVRNNASTVNLTSSGSEKPGRSSSYSLKTGSGKGKFVVNGSYGNVTFE